MSVLTPTRISRKLNFSLNNIQIRIRGEAEAFAIAAKAKAEAEQMSKKAEAWREYREAAMVDMLLDTLPKVSTGLTIENKYFVFKMFPCFCL